MSKDILVVVPPGTRVRFVESPYTNGEVLVMNDMLLTAAPPAELFGNNAALFGLPVYDAEKYTPDE